MEASALPASKAELAALTEDAVPIPMPEDAPVAPLPCEPLEDLARPEAEELLTDVFGDAIEAPAETYDHLRVEEFRSDHVALVSTDPLDDAPAALLSSTLPLRAENEAGEDKLVDLDLEQVGSALEPEDPLAELRISTRLADGFSLPGSRVSIRLASADADRNATQVGEASAFFPNVVSDSDFIVTAAPTGVETFMQMRSPDAPTSQTYELSVPAGHRVEQREDGGAQVVAPDESVVLSVLPPSAVDAEGNQVPAELRVKGTKVEISVTPSSESVYPILVDPLFESFDARGSSYFNSYYNSSWSQFAHPGFYTSDSEIGASIYAPPGPTTPGHQAYWNYYVPRYWTDLATAGVQEAPTSYVKNMKLWNLAFRASGGTNPYPFMQIGLFSDAKQEFVSHASRTRTQGDLSDPNYVYNLVNPDEVTDVKRGGFWMGTFSSYTHGWPELIVGQASVEISDKDIPGFGEIKPVSEWVSNKPGPAIDYMASDSGLGIHHLRLAYPAAAGGTSVSVTSLKCQGTSQSPCPRTVRKSAYTNLIYDPSLMAQGENKVQVYAIDPLNQWSNVSWSRIKVDRTAPDLLLSGNLAEQAKVGTNLPEYTLNYDAFDGDEAAAVAGAPVGSAGTGSGQLERPMGVAADSSGNLYVVDRLNNRVVKFDSAGKFLTQWGSTGTGDGQFNDPRGITVSPNGTVWVVDQGNDRIQAFTSGGAFIRKAKFVDPASQPYAVASGPGGVLWVTDVGLHRLLKLNESGTFLTTATGKQADPASSATDLDAPSGVATDAFGNVWVTDAATHRVIEFSSAGKWLFQFGAPGSGDGQLSQPVGIDVAPSGNLAVVDRGNGRVQVFRPDGAYLRQFGTSGTGSAQLSEAVGIAFGPGNSVAIADAGNKRIARWTHADHDPQSGPSKIEIRVDGTTVKTLSPGCTTKNCAITGSWTLKADDYAVGQHKVEVIATDAVGISTTKTLDVETHGDLQAPTIALSGSMTQQASLGTTRPSYALKVVATDPGSAEERKSGVASTTIKVDGKVVDSSAPGCPAGGCAITREWTLSADNYAVGPHSVQVIATDAAGRSTTKTIDIAIARDTTAPEFTGLSSFYTAPEGWVEQKYYAYIATATDANGYGVTNLQLKIDGEVIKAASGGCSSGGYSRNIGFFEAIDMSKYDGGAHPAELIATDGAGNMRKRTWVINVDPLGNISAGEATDTLEAVELTAPEVTELSPVNGLVTSAISDSGSSPELILEEGKMVSQGTPTPSTVSLDPADGFAVETANATEDGEGPIAQEDIDIVPVQVGASAGSPEITDGSAAVITNTSTNTDTIIRPAFDGVMTFQAIRNQAAPDSYSWEVKLAADETLKLIDGQHAGIFWEDGTQALLIRAQSAHGADGRSVATSLSVSEGSVITLTVNHRVAGVVYPVVSGVGWEGGFQTEQVKLPDDVEAEEGGPTVSLVVAPPEVDGYESSGDGASASSIPKYLIKWGVPICANIGCDFWERRFRGFHWINFKKAWYPDREPVCLDTIGANGIINGEECAWVGPNNQPICKRFSGGPMDPCTPLHITARTRFQGGNQIGPITKTRPVNIVVRAWGTGDTKVYDSDQICNPMRPECEGDYIDG